jgi:hypothetical protein
MALVFYGNDAKSLILLERMAGIEPASIAWEFTVATSNSGPALRRHRGPAFRLSISPSTGDENALKANDI